MLLREFVKATTLELYTCKITEYNSMVEQSFNYKVYTMITILKIFLPSYIFLFFGLAMFWRSELAWRRTGINPYKLGSGDTYLNYQKCVRRGR
jgi:hypothetical protein